MITKRILLTLTCQGCVVSVQLRCEKLTWQSLFTDWFRSEGSFMLALRCGADISITLCRNSTTQLTAFQVQMYLKEYSVILTTSLTLVLLKGGCTNPPNGFRPGAQNRTAKG